MEAQVDKVAVDMYKGGKDKEDMLRDTKPFYEMELKLVCAPLSLNLLGHLCILARGSPRDFKLEGNRFEKLRYPPTLRMGLLQVSNEGHEAFFAAAEALHNIMLSSAQVKDSGFRKK